MDEDEDIAAGDDFDSRCRSLARLLSWQNERALDAREERDLADALRSVTASLPRLLAGRVIGSVAEPADVAQEAIVRFVRAAAAGKVIPSGSPAGYLMRTAMRVLADLRRRPAGPVPAPDVSIVADGGRAIAPDEAVALLDRLASQQTVRDGLRWAAAKDDHTTIMVVGTWLDLAFANGTEPTIREVAETACVSHTTVLRCLKRFRVHLGEAAG